MVDSPVKVDQTNCPARWFARRYCRRKVTRMNVDIGDDCMVSLIVTLISGEDGNLRKTL